MGIVFVAGNFFFFLNRCLDMVRFLSIERGQGTNSNSSPTSIQTTNKRTINGIFKIADTNFKDTLKKYFKIYLKWWLIFLWVYFYTELLKNFLEKNLALKKANLKQELNQQSFHRKRHHTAKIHCVSLHFTTFWILQKQQLTKTSWFIYYMNCIYL